MKIAIDIDNTILAHNSISYKLANIVPQVSSNRLKYKEIQIWDRHRDNLIVKLITRMLGLNKSSNYIVNEELKQIIDTLSCGDNSFVILSSRPDWDSTNLILFRILSSLGFDDDLRIILECNNKVRYLLDNNIDCIIDSSRLEIEKAKRAGIKTILIDKIKHDNSNLTHKNP